jgi:hypothetical protein
MQWDEHVALNAMFFVIKYFSLLLFIIYFLKIIINKMNNIINLNF